MSTVTIPEDMQAEAREAIETFRKTATERLEAFTSKLPPEVDSNGGKDVLAMLVSALIGTTPSVQAGAFAFALLASYTLAVQQAKLLSHIDECKERSLIPAVDDMVRVETYALVQDMLLKLMDGPDGTATMGFKLLIAAAQERNKQVKDGKTAAVDAGHYLAGTLSQAAAAYALANVGDEVRITDMWLESSDVWPWGQGFKPDTETRNSVRAIALLMAEADRTDFVKRWEATNGKGA